MKSGESGMRWQSQSELSGLRKYFLTLGKWGTKIANNRTMKTGCDVCVCLTGCVCASVWVCQAVIRKWMSHFTGCSSPPSFPFPFPLSLSVSLRGSLSCGQQWKWARPCSKCGDLVANPTLFPPLSPLNDAYCILPGMRRRRMEPKLRQSTPPFPSFLLVCAHQPVWRTKAAQTCAISI